MLEVKTGSILTGRKFTVCVENFRGEKLLAFCLIRVNEEGEQYLARHGRSGLKCFLKFADRDMLLSRHPELLNGGRVEISGSIRLTAMSSTGKSAKGEFLEVKDGS